MRAESLPTVKKKPRRHRARREYALMARYRKRMACQLAVVRGEQGRDLDVPALRLYVVFVIDVFTGRITGWPVSRTTRADDGV